MSNDDYSLSLKEAMANYKIQWKQRDKSRLKVVNRRKVNIFKMIQNNDEYFSEESIKRRDPLLYEIYIGWRANLSSSKTITNSNGKMCDFLLSQIDKANFEDDLERAITDDMNTYGRDNIIDELNQVKTVNSKSKSKRADDADELIRLMFIDFLYSETKQPCDSDSDFDNNKDNDDFEEDNYFNSDNEDL